MRRALIFGMLLLAAPGAAPAQQVVDRIVARIEGEILTLSEMRELGHFQQLLGGTPADKDTLLRQLIEQWIVNTEATASRFPRPAPEDVQRQFDAVVKGFGSPEAFRLRLRELGLSEAAARRLLERQIYFARYLDYKFRPAAQVETAEIETYYRDELAPRLRQRNQAVPPLEEVQEQIRELLTQRKISERAARWLEESRQRTEIEIEPGGAP